MRVDLFDFDLPADRIALRPACPRDGARLLQVAGGAISDHGGARSAGAAPARRRAGVQRHPRHPRPARRPARRGPDRRHPAQARGAARLARLRPQRQEAARRRPGRFRRGRRRDGERAGRGRLLPAHVRRRRAGRDCCSNGRADAAAALYRRPAPRRRARPRRLPDHVRARGRGGRGADRGAPFHAGADGGAGRGRHRPRDADPPRRRRHLPAGQGRRHGRSCHARRMGPDRARNGRAAQRRARRGRADHRGRHHVAAPARKRRRRGGQGAPVRRRHRHLHHPRLPLPRDRRPDHQLPPAALDPVHAGLGADGGGGDAGGLCARDRGRLSLLFLRRCEPAERGKAIGSALRTSRTEFQAQAGCGRGFSDRASAQ